MNKSYNYLKLHFNMYKTLYLVYCVITIVLLVITFIFLHKDFAEEDFIVKVYDLLALAIYQTISLVVLSIIINNKYKVLKPVEDKLNVRVINTIIPMLIVFILPIIYILINLNSYNELLGETFYIPLDYFLFYLVGVILSIITQYIILLPLKTNEIIKE